MSVSTVLVLGAGHVAGPLFEYLIKKERTKLIVVSSLRAEIDKVRAKFPSCAVIKLDVEVEINKLSELIRNSDLVISLLPLQLHVSIIKLCIKNKKNMVTASYTSESMEELSSEIENAGISVINETGIDPGIDHFLAVQYFDEVKRKGGQIEEFESYCGGLPDPESSHNPLRYRFTWSPRDALLSVTRPSKYIEDSKIVENTPSTDGSSTEACDFAGFPEFDLEYFPNRDCLPYLSLYNLDGIRKFKRATLRYKGHSAAVKTLQRVGLLDTTNLSILAKTAPDITWRQLVQSLNSDWGPDMDAAILSMCGKEGLSTLNELDLLGNSLVVKLDSPINTLSNHLSKYLTAEPGGRDVVILMNKTKVFWPKERRREEQKIQLIRYGEVNGYSATATMVGTTVGVVASMLLEGLPFKTGLVVPIEHSSTILSRLTEEGIEAEYIQSFI